LESLDFKALISQLEYFVRMKADSGKYKYLLKRGSFERYILISQQVKDELNRQADALITGSPARR
jgi:hypothetical protein